MSSNPSKSAPLFEVSSLSKRYGNTTVVDDLSFEIAAGECLGVIGPNGAGKTTTIRMCLGLSVLQRLGVGTIAVHCHTDAAIAQSGRVAGFADQPVSILRFAGRVAGRHRQREWQEHRLPLHGHAGGEQLGQRSKQNQQLVGRTKSLGLRHGRVIVEGYH